MSRKLLKILALKRPTLDDPRWRDCIGQGKVKRDPAGWAAPIRILFQPTPCHIIPNFYEDWAAVKVAGEVGFVRLPN